MKILRQDFCQNVFPGAGTTAVSFVLQSILSGTVSELAAMAFSQKPVS